MLPSWPSSRIIGQFRFGATPSMRYVVVLLIHLHFIITSCALPNTILVRVQEVLGVIKIWCRKCVLLQGGLDPRITQFIDAAGLTRLFKVLDMEIDHTLITALVERWCLETHMFHLPYGEMGITLQDRHAMERGVPRFFGPWTSAHDTKLKQVYPCWGEDKIQVAWCTVCRSPSCKCQWQSRVATCLLQPTCLDGGPVVHGQVGRPSLTLSSTVAQPNQQCETV